jgi:sec-independent protein translocase protein TatB
MLDIGWSEMAMVALLALIVIGPKDLPRLMRTVGQWVRKARGFARDFQSSLDEMIEDDELREAKRSIEQQTRKMNKRNAFGIGDELGKHVDPDGDLRKSVGDVERQAKATDTGTSSTRSVSHGSSAPAPTSTSDADLTTQSGGGAGDFASGGSGGGQSAADSGGGNGAVFIERETPMAPAHSVFAGRAAAGASGAEGGASDSGENEAVSTGATGTSDRSA